MYKNRSNEDILEKQTLKYFFGCLTAFDNTYTMTQYFKKFVSTEFLFVSAYAE